MNTAYKPQFVEYLRRFVEKLILIHFYFLRSQKSANYFLSFDLLKYTVITTNGDENNKNRTVNAARN